jgi:ABC-type branched-subunit amino acid transport system substrate-binding protein
MISKHARIVFAAAMSALVFGLGGCGPKQPSQAVFVKEIPWIGQGQWLKVETHIHTKFSDGLHTVEQVAERAEHFGCDAIAITDHGDSNLKAASPAQAEAVQAARTAHPRLLILAGLEWNIPPDGGDEHVTVLVPPSPDEWPILAEFKE